MEHPHHRPPARLIAVSLAGSRVRGKCRSTRPMASRRRRRGRLRTTLLETRAGARADQGDGVVAIGSDHCWADTRSSGCDEHEPASHCTPGTGASKPSSTPPTPAPLSGALRHRRPHHQRQPRERSAAVLVRNPGDRRPFRQPAPNLSLVSTTPGGVELLLNKFPRTRLARTACTSTSPPPS